MCIMFIKEPKQSIPSKEQLNICWPDNPHGAGIAWPVQKDGKDQWRVSKGHLTFEAFWNKLTELRETEGLDKKKVIVHLRAGLSGDRKGANHPFPFEAATKENVNFLEYTAHSILFHNGTIGRGTKDFSDTQQAVLLLSPAVLHTFKDNGDYDHGMYRLMDYVLGFKDNRYAICVGKHVYRVGAWVQEEKTGIWWSNSRFTKEETWWYQEEQKKAIKRTQGTVSTLFKKGAIGSLIHVGATTCKKITHMIDGVWNWELWDARYNDLQRKRVIESIKGEGYTDTITKPDPKYVTAYNEKNEEVYLIRREDNTTSTATSNTKEKTFTCPACSIEVTEGEINDGECPYCNTPMETDKKEDLFEYECPVCADKKQIYNIDDDDLGIIHDEYPYAIKLDDFCECGYCGCLWGYVGEEENPWIVGYRTTNEEEGTSTFTYTEIPPANAAK